MKPRILLVDDHEILTSALAFTLSEQENWQVLPPLTSGKDALDCPAGSFELLITDLAMPGIDGFDLIKALQDRPNPPQILVLTASENPGDLRQVVATGVSGLVSKADSLDEVVDACRAILGGKSWLSPRLKGLLPRTTNLFTPAEDAVAAHLAAGKSLKETAAALRISPKTAALHRQHIMKKLNLSEPNQLLRWLWERPL